MGAGAVLIPGLPLLKLILLSQVANGVLIPFVLVFMLILVNKRGPDGRLEERHMGQRDSGHNQRGDDRADRHDGLEFAPRRLNLSAHACDNTCFPMSELKTLIREVPDFPKPGILFYDITTLIKDKAGFRGVIDGLKSHYADTQVDVVLGIEARGFIFAPALGVRAGRGLRAGAQAQETALAECVSVTYDLEYGTDTLEMHRDAVGPGDRVLIVDDLLATGGTAAAAASMVQRGRRHRGGTGLRGRIDLPERTPAAARPRRLLAPAVRQMSRR